ncbi:J domain-containing protein [Natronorubrum daqingense]|uniref:DnaJ domain-containing protein n=1 Tax=Natronorubrum daqingense TaxID=588898 RepID=A0A1N7DQ62_9EURY|nr:DnaJ domain-containing protein [Natronorubrum daqingense]APX96106.1 molecular chaperone DnaJ [Natronorubrum daqingense]SIR77970.1 DnaJ domain-containing protein [Natronorubrum daqingense]
MTEDFYDLLDVPSDASQDEIKTAYREKVREYHPDHNDDERARAQFTAVKKAYDILGDPVEQQAYDRLGHEDYVAKRTSGLPSASVWRSSDDNDDDTNSSSSSASASSSATKQTASATSGATGTSKTTSSTDSAGTGTGTGARTGAGTSKSTGTQTTSGSTRSTSQQTATASGTQSERNAAVRWWRRQNFSLPLIWGSLFVYLAGLAHFALENEAELTGLAGDFGAVGGDSGELWELLATGRHGVDPVVSFLAAFEPFAVPLEAHLWYAALGGITGLTGLTLLGARVRRSSELFGALSIDETIVLAVALGVTTVLVGGPLLAGAVLMPLLFLVIVQHTRRGPGWTPSYLYVLPVLGPLAGLGIGLGVGGEPTLVVDLIAFVLLPIVGGLALPIRATIRKHLGR